MKSLVSYIKEEYMAQRQGGIGSADIKVSHPSPIYSPDGAVYRQRIRAKLSSEEYDEYAKAVAEEPTDTYTGMYLKPCKPGRNFANLTSAKFFAKYFGLKVTDDNTIVDIELI